MFTSRPAALLRVAIHRLSRCSSPATRVSGESTIVTSTDHSTFHVTGANSLLFAEFPFGASDDAPEHYRPVGHEQMVSWS